MEKQDPQFQVVVHRNRGEATYHPFFTQGAAVSYAKGEFEKKSVYSCEVYDFRRTGRLKKRIKQLLEHRPECLIYQFKKDTSKWKTPK